ncbi:MAG: tetratricopeptide repeat protein [Flavisolibacter sp.]
MKKSAIGLFFAAFLSLSALAQSVQEGMNYIYAQRFQSAKTTFEKLLAANPNNIEATYWLGQAYIGQKNIPAARSLYEKALVTNGNAPLIMAGLGHVELLEGKKGEARSHFESAINASKGKKSNDPAILDAVGRANVNAYSESNKAGDLDYAITKLTEASQIAPNNADIFLNLGNAYRKKVNKGGEAVQAYRQALQVNPSFAVAPYRTAKLYQTQVSYRQPEAWSVVLENLNAAVAADAKFAPAYEELYYYYLFSKQDFPTAEKYADLYINNSDPSVENDYFKFQILLVQKKYDEAAPIGKRIISQTNNNANPRVYRAMAVVYMGQKDTTSACDMINTFFTKAADEDILGTDYIIRAQACGRNNPELIERDIVTAVMRDSVLTRQLAVLNEAIDDAKTSGNRIFEATLRMLSYKLRYAKDPKYTSPTELISYMAVPFAQGGAYMQADSVAKEYTKLAPDSIYGYYWSARALQAIDSGATPQGLAIANYQKVLDIALTDTARYRTQGVNAASSLAIYYYNVKNDLPAAKQYVEQGLKFDANSSNLLNIQRVLNSVKSGGGAKTNSTSNQAKEKTPTSKTKTTPTKTKVKGKG